MSATSKDFLFVILAPNRTDLYWRPKSCGYTTNLAEAGVYAAGEASCTFRDGKSDRGDRQVALASLVPELVDLRKKMREDIDNLTGMIRRAQGLPAKND